MSNGRFDAAPQRRPLDGADPRDVLFESEILPERALDPLSLLYALLLTSGIVAADAAVNANTITSRIVVNETMKRTGLTEEAATQAFTQRLSQIFAQKSLLRSASVRASTSKSFVSHIAHAARLEDVQAAFQDLIGLETVQVTGMVLEEGGRQTFQALCSGREVRCDIRLERKEAETSLDFLRRGAMAAAAQIDPYHAAVAVLDPDDGAPDPVLARAILEKRLAALPDLPVSEPRALALNLLGIVELLDNRKDEAEKRFRAALATSPRKRFAQLNLAFVLVERDDYEGARAVARDILTNPGDDIRVASAAGVISGVANWALKRYAEAERDFALAARRLPDATDAYLYWADMLDELGRPADAAEKRRIGRQNQATFDNYAEIALLYFWLNKNDNQPLRLRKSGLVRP